MTTDTTLTPELLDQLLANYEKPEDLTGADGLFKQLKALIERALVSELSDHLGYEKGDPAGRGSGTSRNGTSAEDDPDRGRQEIRGVAVRFHTVLRPVCRDHIRMMRAMQSTRETVRMARAATSIHITSICSSEPCRKNSPASTE